MKIGCINYDMGFIGSFGMSLGTAVSKRSEAIDPMLLNNKIIHLVTKKKKKNTTNILTNSMETK